MHVGLAYDLKDDYLAQGYSLEAASEFDSPQTIDAIEAVLKKRGFTVTRIGHIKQLAARLVKGERWDFVFNIAEGAHGLGREAQVPALLDAYQIPYLFSDTVVMALTLNKALTKSILRDANIPTAPFAVIEQTSDLASVQLPYPLFVKPIAEGTGKGITNASYVENAKQLSDCTTRLLAQFHQPVLVESFLPGREFTVGMLGTGHEARTVAVMEILFNEKADKCGYTFENKQYYTERVSYQLADDEQARQAAKVALAAWKALGCRDGGRIDIRSDANGNPHFLEVNPLAGLHPEVGDLVILSKLAGLSYEGLLGQMIDSLLKDSVRFPQNQQQMTVSKYA